MNDDEETNEADTTRNKTDNSNEETNKHLSPLEETKGNFKKLKEANDRVEAELLRKEELRAKMAMGGDSEAGSQPIEKKEISDKEYADKVMAGEIPNEKEE